MKKNAVQKLALSGLFLSLCMLLPLLTGQIPYIGKALAPMHIPVYLCGLVCGWPYGLAVGVLAPLLRYLLFGMPPILPTGVAMTLELATYGLVSGLAYKLLPRKGYSLFIALIAAMLAGRVAWGAARTVLAGMTSYGFTWAVFLAEGFVNAVPGIICHIALIPPVVYVLEKTRLVPGARGVRAQNRSA